MKSITINNKQAKTLVCFVLIFISLLGSYCNATEFSRWIVYVPYKNNNQVELIKKKFDHFKRYPEKKLILLEIDQSEYNWLESNNFEIKVDSKKTQQLYENLKVNRNASNHVEIRKPENIASIPGFSCYRTVEETFSTAQSLVSSYPLLATWNDIGDSWEKTQNALFGYDINVLKITNSAITDAKPPLIITSGVHAREYANSELMTRFAEWLLSEYGKNPDATWLVDYRDIHLILSSNPDGRKMAELGISWRKNTNDNTNCSNPNNVGIDLNRNFDFQWGCCGGSSTNACSATYRGIMAASEPEALAISNYMSSVFADQRDDDLNAIAPDTSEGIYLDIHSFGEVILSSWGFSTTTPPPNGDGILRLARKFAFFNNYTPQLGSTGVVDGSTKDFTYGRMGVPGYTIELGTAFFEDCNYFENSIVEKNIKAIVYAAKAASRPYMIPLGPDVANLQPFEVPYIAGQMAIISAQADDTRYTNGSGTEPTQNILAAEMTINTPPWSMGAIPISMVATDGTFDQKQEDIEGIIDTSALAPGKHKVFFRAKDVDNNWGAVSALFLQIIDPALAPVIFGTVKDINTNNPIPFATITINSFVVQADGSGEYSLQVPAGVYEISVSVDGYQTEMENNINVVNSINSQHDFSLIPLITILEDKVESGNIGWTTQGGWAITDESSISPTHSWTDSPGGNYPNNANFSLTSPLIDFTNFTNPILKFKHLQDFEATFDFGYVEVSTNNGATWEIITTYNGSNASQWETTETQIPQLSNVVQAQIRFRLTSDTSIVKDGWHIDDIEILAPLLDLGIIFSNGFE